MNLKSNTKNNEAEIADKTKIPLNRSIGLATAILIVACTVIGSGVFKKIAPMSAMLMNQNYILLAWLLAGIISIFGAFTIAGMASLTNESGGIYEYLRLSFGNLFSFLYGWASFIILGCGGNAAVAFIFAQSVNSIVPLPNPLEKWKDLSFGHIIYPFESSGIKILSIAAIIILTMVNIIGAKKGGSLNNLLTVIKVIGILLLIIMGIAFTGSPHIQEVTHITTTGTNIFSAIIAAMVSAFWAYDGWYCIGFMSGEIKNPQKNIPVSIISGLGIVIVLYLLLNYAFMHVLPLSTLAGMDENSIAAVEVSRIIAGNTGVIFLAVLIAVSTFGTLNALILTYARLYYKMAQEKFFPKKFGNVHPRYHTPYVSLKYSCVWSCILVFSGTFDILTDTVILVEFLFFILLGWALIKMKREGKITSKLIAYPVSPVILILFSLGLVINSIIVQPVEAVAGIIFTLSGVPLYYYYKKRKVVLVEAK